MDKHPTDDLAKRGTPRTTYEIFEGKLKYVPKPDRIKELAKNLEKLKTLENCTNEKTIYHLINTFPELKVIIKENETCRKDPPQKPTQERRNDPNSYPMVEYVQNENMHVNEKELDARIERKDNPLSSGELEVSTNIKQNGRRSTSKNRSSRTSTLQSESRKMESKDKGFDYINQIEIYDLTREDDQESIDKLEAHLMDESIIELTNTFR